jgi:hypothetical protein
MRHLLYSGCLSGCIMKFVAGIMLLAISSSAFAASNKLCRGTGRASGKAFTLEYSWGNRIQVGVLVGDDIDSGEYGRRGTGAVRSSDGTAFVEFDRRDTELLLDEELLKQGTHGLAKVRNKSGISTFMCYDDHS